MNTTKSIRVGILGATGMVGQRFITLLQDHPWFIVTTVAASKRSAGKTYAEAVEGRWSMTASIPATVKELNVYAVEDDLKTIAGEVDFVFCALDAEKEVIRSIEEAYAEAGIPVVSNNSAHRHTEDVPMIMPEVNPHHLDMIPIQQKKRGWSKGFIAVKPNCSIQSYVPALEALKAFGPKQVIVSTYQAISGAGKTFESWPEMVDNINPLIGGEEGKSEQEPMKIWANISNDQFVLAKEPIISAHCIRVPVSDGHFVTVNVSFEKTPTKEELIEALRSYENPIASLKLPSAPEPFIIYFDEEDRPQTKLDRDLGNGMGVSVGRLRIDPVLGWKFVSLSHNTVRGAAGGAILVAELLQAKGYITAQ